MFAFGLVLIFAAFAIGFVFLEDVQARRSYGPFLGFCGSSPMLWIAFVCCTASPLFSRSPPWLKFLLTVGGALAFAVTFAVCFALLWVLRPPMV
jgi:hypothetical protein